MTSNHIKILEKLSDQGKFSSSEIAIANYILHKKEDILRMSAQEICKQTYTSTSSLIQLCRKIGLEGFKDFKISFAAELERQAQERRDIDYDFPFQKDDSILDIAQKMSVIMSTTLNSAYSLLAHNYREMNKAVDLILSSRRTALFAMGDSLLKGLVFRANMLKIDELVLVSSMLGEESTLTDILADGDCAIIVSYSGNSKSLYEQVKILRKHHVPLIVISSDPDSVIGRQAKLLLRVPEHEDKWSKQATFSSQTSTEYMLNVLYSCVYVRKFGESSMIRMKNIEEHSDTRF